MRNGRTRFSREVSHWARFCSVAADVEVVTCFSPLNVTGSLRAVEEHGD